MKTGLLHPYPGSKANCVKYPIWDGNTYDCVVEPFVGAGHFSHRMLMAGRCNAAFVADIDPAVRTVWQCWKSRKLRDYVESLVIQWQIHIARDAKSAFEDLCDVIECDGCGETPAEVTAASIVLRRLTFGGVLRCNAQGGLNVALSQDKLTAFEKWEFQWPYFCDEWNLSIAPAWNLVFNRFERSPYKNAVCFIDPPYWLPRNSRPGRRGTGAMTPAYMAHGDPSGDELFRTCVEAVDRALGNPRIKRIVVTNYLSEPLQDAIAQLAQQYGRKFWLTNLGPLQTMNKQQGQRSDAPHEAVWEFGGQRMFGVHEQLSLFGDGCMIELKRDKQGIAHIVALSGGKDSTALALLLNEQNPEISYNYICTPTGDELPAMFEHWRRLGCLLGSPILPIMGGTLKSVCKEEKCLPNWRMRFCTRRLKIEPFLAFVLDNQPCISYVGLRADEETRAGARLEKHPDIKYRYPFKEQKLKLDDIWGILDSHNVTIPKRTDCARCFFQKIGEWWDLWNQYPEIFDDAIRDEEKYGHTYRSPGRDTWPAALKDLKAEFEKGRIPRGNSAQLDLLSSYKCRECTL